MIKLLENLCLELNSNASLKAEVGLRSDAVNRIRDLWASVTEVGLIFYWGCFARDGIGHEENDLVLYVDRIRRMIAQNGPCECHVEVIYTDTHARLNGASEARIASYYESSKSILTREGWGITPLSDIVAGGIVENNDEVLGFYKREVNILNKQASAIHGEKAGQEMAIKYLSANLLESAYIFRHYPRSIFLHAGVSELTFMLPSLPRLHIFTGENRCTAKPWFLPQDDEG